MALSSVIPIVMPDVSSYDDPLAMLVPGVDEDGLTRALGAGDRDRPDVTVVRRRRTEERCARLPEVVVVDVQVFREPTHDLR
jgi:hypothetical protein